MKKIDVRDMILVSVFVALMVVSAFIKITFLVVPFTLQSMVVLLSGLILGPKLAALSMSTYILMGLVGLPVFAKGAGFGYVLSHTFGYLLGFVFAELFIGAFAGPKTRASLLKKIAVCIGGVLIISVFGILYWYVLSNFILGNPVDFTYVLWYGMLIFLPKDIAFCIVCAMIGERVGIRREMSFHQ